MWLLLKENILDKFNIDNKSTYKLGELRCIMQ